MTRWSTDKIQEWYGDLPYLAGANFVPSSASNQLEMWQAETFDPERIERELRWAADLGMTMMRVFLHDLLWEQEGFLQRVDRYLAIASSLGIGTCLVFFDDCWNPDPRLGPQLEPVPYTHNSRWLQSPGAAGVNDPSCWDRLERYVKGVLEHFKADSRVIFWDLYNEPGNGPGGDPSTEGTLQKGSSLPLLKEVFRWAREVEGLSQPVTAGIWNDAEGYEGINDFLRDASDLITFHSYEPPEGLAERIALVVSPGRPMVCTEYMARPRSTFREILPILKERKVGAVNWGLAAGRSHTIYPWRWEASKGEPEFWFHDVFRPDGSMLYEEEREIIRGVLKG